MSSEKRAQKRQMGVVRRKLVIGFRRAWVECILLGRWGLKCVRSGLFEYTLSEFQIYGRICQKKAGAIVKTKEFRFSMKKNN